MPYRDLPMPVKVVGSQHVVIGWPNLQDAELSLVAGNDPTTYSWLLHQLLRCANYAICLRRVLSPSSEINSTDHALLIVHLEFNECPSTTSLLLPP